ncbi:hypothetical protein MMC24_003587 [Lignoscripta atroalba]|nr:hypothetical protein [Lignoscripta atroalba]
MDTEAQGNDVHGMRDEEVAVNTENWTAIFDQVQRELPKETKVYKAPDLGTTEFAKSIDYTLLKPEATKEQIDQLCEETRINGFKSVCVRLKWVKYAASLLRDTSVVIACVVGFPEGTYDTPEKSRETTEAVSAGASELDMVLNYPALKKGNYSIVYEDIAAVRSAAPPPTILKVILETSQLSRAEIIAGCKIAQAARADFVKTSTGFNGEGATVENVRLMKAVVGDTMKVKASGGVKTVEDCVRMMEAGAERIGTSGGVLIMKEADKIALVVTGRK